MFTTRYTSCARAVLRHMFVLHSNNLIMTNDVNTHALTMTDIVNNKFDYPICEYYNLG